MEYQELKDYYKSIAPIQENHCDNKVKCVLQMVHYIEARNVRPDLLIIDDLFYREFSDFMKDEKFKKVFDKVDVVMVERFGSTRFHLHNIRGHK